MISIPLGNLNVCLSLLLRVFVPRRLSVPTVLFFLRPLIPFCSSTPLNPLLFLRLFSFCSSVPPLRLGHSTFDVRQELVAMASANVVGSMFKAYPASGSLSRTAVVQSVGAKTRMHLIPAVLVVMLVLVAITPLLYTLPKAILGSVVRAEVFVDVM